MKTNKLAAGALALALGLGAVTPAFAESTMTENSGKGEVIITAEYRQAETEFVEAFKALKEANKTLDELKTISDSKYEVVLQAKEAIEDYHEKLKEYDDRFDNNEAEAAAVLGDFTGNGGTANISGTLAGVKPENLTVNEKGFTEEKVTTQVNTRNKYLSLVEKEKLIAAEKKDFINDGKTLDDLRDKHKKALEEYQQALVEYEKQKPVVKEAESDYKDTRASFILAGGDRSDIGLAEKYGDVSYVTDATPSEDGDEDDDTDAKEAIEAAEAALEDAKVTAKGAKLLLDSYPETVKTVRDDLVKLLAEQEEKIEALNKALEAAKGKSVALSDILFSTAYAAEEESDPIEELKKATEDLEENTQAIKDKLAENEEANKEANENADPEPDADPEPSDDNEPSDEMNSDENEEKPAEKTETKTEVKTVKKPAKNAKTGVVGVAGVAGVLAAASVAYAASKKNN